MSENRDLGLAALAATVCAALAVVLPWEGARVAVALPLAFFLPGYAIVAGLGPRPLELPLAIMLWLGCSLSVLCLGGLLLNYTPGGIQTAPWAVLLALVVAFGCGVAYVRNGGEGDDGAPVLAPHPIRRRPRSIDLLLGVVAVALAAGAVVLANTPLKADGAAGYTSLWIDPATDGQHGVLIGVQSSEHDERGYLLAVQSDHGPRKVISRFALRPDDQHVFTVIVPDSGRGSTLVKGLLYRQSDPTDPLREVRIFLPPKAS